MIYPHFVDNQKIIVIMRFSHKNYKGFKKSYPHSYPQLFINADTDYIVIHRTNNAQWITKQYYIEKEV